YRTMVEMRNNGVPLYEQAPKAAITQSILQLTDLLAGNVSEEKDTADSKKDKAVAGAAGWLSFWPGKAKPKAKTEAKTEA
ncbi:MAG: hypothetical protein ACK53L_18835, partial [Pirellulaceae bacterium]